VDSACEYPYAQTIAAVFCFAPFSGCNPSKS
jgi:hypothetical protein